MAGYASRYAIVALEADVTHDDLDEVVGSNVWLASALFEEYLAADAIPHDPGISTTASGGRPCHLFYRTGPLVTDTP